MNYFLDINSVFFTVMDYPMSYIEFFGTILNIACVWLVARNKILNWPVGIVATALFGILFLQIHLYSDFFEQIYFFITGFWGWYVWSQGKKDAGESVPITSLTNKARAYWSVVIAAGTFVLGLFTAHIHEIFPKAFTVAASYPFLDAFTTVLSFVATIMMIRKQRDNWYLWILVDMIGICLYWAKDVKLVSLLYVVFLVIATSGLIHWTKVEKNQKSK